MVRVAQHLFEKEPCLLDIAGTSKTLDVPESAYVECALASPQSIDSSVAGIAVDQAVIKEPITGSVGEQHQRTALFPTESRFSWERRHASGGT